MTTSMLAFGKATAVGRVKAPAQAYRIYSTASASASANGSAAQPKAVDAAAQRELFVNVLNANATKRDAKQYLARFKEPKSRPAVDSIAGNILKGSAAPHRHGVNLGNLYGSARAIAESPQFAQEHVSQETPTATQPTMHVALVLLRALQTLDDATLNGVALTLSQLVKLDMRILVVLDCNVSSQDADVKTLSETYADQAARLNKAVLLHSPEGSRLINGAIEISETPKATGHGASDGVSVVLPQLLLDPLHRSVIPIVPSMGYTSSGQLTPISAGSVMSALTFLLSGLPNNDAASSSVKAPMTMLDRIIVLDQIGGIPSNDRENQAHVLINLEQEYSEIEQELTQNDKDPSDGRQSPYEQHQSNLKMLQTCLSMLPSTSSALIITPEEAASSSRTAPTADDSIGPGTRRRKNTLIHNLLTNKPMISPSLPAARISSTTSSINDLTATPDTTRSTLVKRGMPLAIIPTVPRGQGWHFPSTGETSLDLEADPQIDLSRLLYLIEDSFRRKLDLQHYLDRVRNRIAGLIIAGSYEGAAILTWEQPHGTADPSRLVPYLDKFAVLSTSQGSAGVADILFQAMVRTCFPDGVCWRSRKDNPVNKWYFERADGHWQIPGTNWTMFWTGEEVVGNEERWEDYVSVCRSVLPSWADGKKPD